MADSDSEADDFFSQAMLERIREWRDERDPIRQLRDEMIDEQYEWILEINMVEFCPPFSATVSVRPLVFDPAWRTETVLALARGVEADAAYDRLPILADALEEAGCDLAEVLTHCRHCNTHIPGCWVLELVLDRPAVAIHTPRPSPSPLVPPSPTVITSTDKVTPFGIVVWVVVGLGFLWALTAFLAPLCQRFTSQYINRLTTPRLQLSATKPIPPPATTP